VKLSAKKKINNENLLRGKIKIKIKNRSVCMSAGINVTRSDDADRAELCSHSSSEIYDNLNSVPSEKISF
jgi:hypothetical protein